MFESILLVDDEANARKGMTQFLQGLDYDVMTATNGKEGLELFKKESPDLVISDIRMPEMDGIELLGPAVRPEAAQVHLAGLQDEEGAPGVAF